MDRFEYSNIFNQEDNHFWYKINREMGLALIKKYTPISSTRNILDAGCGTGGTTRSLVQFGKVTGVDISPYAINFSQKRRLSKIVLGSVNKLPFKNQIFDLVTSFDVLYHQRVDPTKALSEFFRVLRKGGCALIRVPALEILKGSHDDIVQTKHRFTKLEIENMVKMAGFKVVKLTYFNMWLLPFLLIKRKFFRAPVSDVESIPKFINDFLYFISKIELSVAINWGLPIGSSVYCLAKK